MSCREVTACGLCDSVDLELVLDLGASPPPCSMLRIGDERDQPSFPLALLRCRNCRLVQLSCIVDPRLVFPPDYPYSSGNSGQLRTHFATLASQLTPAPDDLVVDIGANDGTFLQRLDCRRIAVDPTDQLRHAGDGIIACQEFFGRSVAERILAEHGPARYITAFNVLAHVADPHDVAEGIRILLADEGRLVTENHDVANIVSGQWDFVYHEHLRYYAPGTLARLLEEHGLYVYHETAVPTHGGSFRSWASKSVFCDALGVTNTIDHDWRAVRETAKRRKWYLRSIISANWAAGERVAAVGATARGTTIINYCELTSGDLEAVYEVSGSDKLGRMIPGTRIPVLDERALFEPDAPGVVVLLSWHLADLIVPKLRAGGYNGEIIVPLRDLQVIKPEATACSPPRQPASLTTAAR